jgi:hypothetical protein
MDFETTRLIVEVVIGVFITPMAFMLWTKLVAVEKATQKSAIDLAEFKLHVAIEHATLVYVDKKAEEQRVLFDAMFKKLDIIQDEIRQFYRELDRKQDRPN